MALWHCSGHYDVLTREMLPYLYCKRMRLIEMETAGAERILWDAPARPGSSYLKEHKFRVGPGVAN